MGRTIPPRALSLDDGTMRVSAQEAARLLGVSVRSIYGYVQKGQLRRVWIEGRTMLFEKEGLAFARRVPGRARSWCLPNGAEALYLTTIIVPVRPDCEAALEAKLAEFRARNTHRVADTCACAFARSLREPERLTILLFWREEELPSPEQRAREIAALGADLAQVCAWNEALTMEGLALGCAC